MSTANQYYSGTSGLMVPLTRDRFPPMFAGKSRLEFYSSLFNSLEVNSIFYKPPRRKTIENWVQQVPAAFRFSFKLPREVSHAPSLLFEPGAVHRFMQLVTAANARKGMLLLQLPPSLGAGHRDQLGRLLELLNGTNEKDRWPVAVEFRHSSWWQEGILGMLEETVACPVVHDLPESATPAVDFKSGFAYFRFHGPGGRYRGSYDDRFLEGYGLKIRAALAEGKTVYAYFNNTMGQALDNLQTLNGMVADLS